MGHGIGAAHDPSVAVRRRHLPALRAGRKKIQFAGRYCSMKARTSATGRTSAYFTAMS